MHVFYLKKLDVEKIKLDLIRYNVELKHVAYDKKHYYFYLFKKQTKKTSTYS